MMRISALFAFSKTVPASLAAYSTNIRYKLSEVGVLDQFITTCYPTGQIFLHRLFGYRGVILFPWTACIFDKYDHTNTPSSSSSVQSDKSTSEKISKTGPPPKNLANKLSYYQVLIDNRDIPYIR